ncbi:MAG: DUF4397 domain-containing protein [Bacteroidales bacterium]|nr:DUF4397 domain-containing protein [Bacteroidales bacterium]
MKKLFILSILFPLVFLSCNKDPEPEPEVIRAYCYLHHFVPELESVTWVVDDIETPDDLIYGGLIPGAVVLEAASEEISFIVKNSETGEVLESRVLLLEEDKYYKVIICGSKEDPLLLFQEVETSRPQSGQVKFQILHAAPGQDSIDVYMGGTSPDKRVISELDYKELSDPFEVQDYDVIAAITISIHSEEYNQDSVLLTSIYNDLIVSGASYLAVVAPYTFDPLSELTFWLYDLPLE